MMVNEMDIRPYTSFPRIKITQNTIMPTNGKIYAHDYLTDKQGLLSVYSFWGTKRSDLPSGYIDREGLFRVLGVTDNLMKSFLSQSLPLPANVSDNFRKIGTISVGEEMPGEYVSYVPRGCHKSSPISYSGVYRVKIISKDDSGLYLCFFYRDVTGLVNLITKNDEVNKSLDNLDRLVTPGNVITPSDLSVFSKKRIFDTSFDGKSRFSFTFGDDLDVKGQNPSLNVFLGRSHHSIDPLSRNENLFISRRIGYIGLE